MGSRGGEIGLGGRDKLLDVSVCVSSIILHCEQVIGFVFEHQGAGGLILRVQGIQGNQAPFQIQPLKELSGHRDLIGLVFFHDRSAQIKLAWNGDGAQHGLTTTMPGFFAIQNDQVFLGRLAPHLLLNGQDGFFDFAAIDVLKKPAKSRLMGRRVFALPE